MSREKKKGRKLKEVMEMFQWVGIIFAMLELGIIVYHTIKKEKVPMIPICICSALILVLIMLHLSTR